MAKQTNFSADTHFANPESCTWNLPGSIHIWKFPIGLADFYLLNKSEKELAGRFHFDSDRLRFSTGRQALRMLASKYLSVRTEDILLSAEKNKKPFIVSPSNQLHFNISHSGNWVIIAFGEVELGIDIEQIQINFSFIDLLPEHFSIPEQAFVEEAHDPAFAFYFLWTRKESLTKAWGTGLRQNLKAISVLDNQSGMHMNHKTWKFESFNLSSDYPAAISFEAGIENLLYFDGSGLLNQSQSK